MEAVMNRSSSPGPEESALGKRAREGDDSGDQDDAEPDDERPTPATTEPQSLPSLSNITAATLRYASKKKLRPEQRDELEVFLSVSSPFISFFGKCGSKMLVRTQRLVGRPSYSRVFSH